MARTNQPNESSRASVNAVTEQNESQSTAAEVAPEQAGDDLSQFGLQDRISKLLDQAKATPVERQELPQYRNISPTLLTLDDGTPLPRNQTAGLTDAEVKRFAAAGKAAGQPYVYAV